MKPTLKIYFILLILALIAVAGFFAWPREKADLGARLLSQGLAAKILPDSWLSYFQKPEQPETAPETALSESESESTISQTLSGRLDLQPKKPKKMDTNLVQDFIKNNPEFADKPIVKRSESSVTFEENGKYITEIFSSPVHYKDRNGELKEIDTTLQYFPETNEYGTEWSETRIKPDGTVKIIDDKGKTIHIQKTSRAGKFSETTKEFTPIINSLPQGSPEKDTLIQTAGDFTHRLKLTDLGLKEELVISEPPNGEAGDWLVMETSFGTSKLFPDGWLDDFEKAGKIFPPPTGTDANGKELPIKRYARFVDGKQYVYTGILGSTLTGVVYPVTIDPDYLDSTNDGHVEGWGYDYATARSASSGFDSTSTLLKIGQYLDSEGGTGYFIWRDFLKFDTSAIPDGDTITQVNLKMVCTFDFSDIDFDVQIVKQNWSAQDPLSAANREAAYDNCLAGTADDNILGNTSSIVLVDGHYHFTSGNLNTAWINKTGNTYYSLRSSRDYGNNAPFAGFFEEINLASQNHGTVAYKPILTVLHAPPPDPTWATGAADFKIYESSSLTWGAGTLVCSGTLTDDNASTINCASGRIKDNTQYRVQVILKNAGGALNMQGVSDYVDHKNVKAGWAGTSPTLGNCGFYDVGTDNGSTTCTAAWNATNNVRITNTGAGNVVIGATTGTEGFMYLITAGSDVPGSSATGYFDTSIDTYTEDSSKISVNGPGRTTIQGTLEFGGSVTVE